MRFGTAWVERAAGLRPPPLWVAALLVAACHGAYAAATGITTAPDTASYAYWAGRLIESGFDYPTLLSEADTGFPAALYALFATLLAVLRLVFGGGWPAALVAINFGADVALGVLIVRLAVRATESGAAGWAALLLFLICFDLFRWVPFVLSDASFALIAFVIFTLAAARILGEARGWGRVLGLAGAGIFYRPTGIVLVPDLLWAIYLSRARRAPPRRAVAAALAAAAAGAALLVAWLVQDPRRWPFVPLSGAVRAVADGYRVGEVVSARPETFHAVPSALSDYMLISADRFLHFFAVDAAAFSAGHRLAELAFFLPCYALAGWLAAAMWRGSTGFSAPQRKLFLAAFGAVLAYAVFHGLVQVDFDWRYRAPILPHLILLAAGGLADLLRRGAAR